ncbi:MAG: hypothetical protein F6J89_27555 [Symploca sp. SIO1C4]|uniref:Uncharacterized protein n=1 Tax=Symploca sp. SIO1C4 TaxID=2607765 RepID=A0A6B3NHX2_9CYAN|nr:hypothetical protein [Symploca sp. SIO1C4]
MASSDEFRRKLRAGKIAEAFALAVGEAVDLRITTWVVSGPDNVDPEQARHGYRLRTRINMIDGDINNEVGDQFIASGPYRELRQFHLDQVAQGQEIIYSNLKSLQRIFEVLVTMHRQGASTPSLTPETSDFEGQLLPPGDDAPEAGWVIDSPDWEQYDSVYGTDEVFDVDVAPVPSPNFIESNQFPSTSIDTPEVFEEDTYGQDSDDSVSDWLESLPPMPPSTPKTPDSNMEYDWEEEDQQESWLESAPSNQVNQDIETFPGEDIDNTNSPLDQDWDYVVEPEQQTLLEESTSSTSSIDVFENDQDWDDWIFEEYESGDTSVEDGESWDLEEDEGWNELVEEFDPLELAPEIQDSAAELDTEEDWDEFAEYAGFEQATLPEQLNPTDSISPANDTSAKTNQSQEVSSDNREVSSAESESPATQTDSEKSDNSE